MSKNLTFIFVDPISIRYFKKEELSIVEITVEKEQGEEILKSFLNKRKE